MLKSQEEVLDCSHFVTRTVYRSRKHPQVGYIFLEGKKTPVFVGWYLEEPTWTVALSREDPRYKSSSEQTVPYEEDPAFECL